MAGVAEEGDVDKAATAKGAGTPTVHKLKCHGCGKAFETNDLKEQTCCNCGKYFDPDCMGYMGSYSSNANHEMGPLCKPCRKDNPTMECPLCEERQGAPDVFYWETCDLCGVEACEGCIRSTECIKGRVCRDPITACERCRYDTSTESEESE